MRIINHVVLQYEFTYLKKAMMKNKNNCYLYSNDNGIIQVTIQIQEIRSMILHYYRPRLNRHFSHMAFWNIPMSDWKTSWVREVYSLQVKIYTNSEYNIHYIEIGSCHAI